jgi:6-phosphofructokinase 1
LKRIAVLTSGGDAPGMNGVIRAVVRTGIEMDLEVWGVRHGFVGLLQGDYGLLGRREVGGIMQHGGTVLGSARSDAFQSDEGQASAIRSLRQAEIEGLVVIGGNGSQMGSLALWRRGFPVVGVASTIDNDLGGSEITLGVDTALNIALEAIDRLKTTASSHQRAFLVEVMGRACGSLALMAGVAGGAELILVPEVETPPDAVAQTLRSAYERGKPHAIAVVAEGARYNATALEAYFRENQATIGFQVRTTILGHVQRGGSPTAFDRLLGTRFGVAAVEALISGNHGVLVGINHSQITTTPLEQAAPMRKPLDPELLRMAKFLEL